MSNKEKDIDMNLDDITLDLEIPDIGDDDLDLDEEELDMSSQESGGKKRGRKPKIIHANIDHGDSKELLSTILRTNATDLLRFVEETEKENDYQKKIHAEAVKQKLAEERAEKNKKKAERKNNKQDASTIDDEDQEELDEDALDTQDAIVLEEELELTLPEKEIIEDPSFHDEDLFHDKTVWKPLTDEKIIQNNSYKKAIRPVFRMLKTFALLEKQDIGDGKNPLERLFIMTPEKSTISRDKFNELVEEIKDNCDKEEDIHNDVTFGGNFSKYNANVKIMITNDASYMYVKENKEYIVGKSEYIYAFSGGREYLAEHIRQKQKFLFGDALQHKVDEMIQDNNKAVETALFAIQNNNDNNQIVDLHNGNINYRQVIPNLENITPCGINGGHVCLNTHEMNQEVILANRDVIMAFPEYDNVNKTPDIGMRLVDNKLCAVLKTENYEAIFKPLDGSLMTAKQVHIKCDAKNINGDHFYHELTVNTDNLSPGCQSKGLYEKVASLLNVFAHDISDHTEEKKEFIERNISNKFNNMSVGVQRNRPMENNLAV